MIKPKTRGNFFNLIKNNYEKPTVEVHFRNGILRKYVNQFSNRMRINGENYVLKTPFKNLCKFRLRHATKEETFIQENTLMVGKNLHHLNHNLLSPSVF